jgi:hypothetical protein
MSAPEHPATGRFADAKVGPGSEMGTSPVSLINPAERGSDNDGAPPRIPSDNPVANRLVALLAELRVRQVTRVRNDENSP